MHNDQGAYVYASCIHASCIYASPRITFSVGPSVTEKFRIIDAWTIPRIMHQDWGSYIHTSWVHTSRRPEGPQTRSWSSESHYRSKQIIIALCSVFHISCDMCTSLPYDRLRTNQGELLTSESELCILFIVDCHTVVTLLLVLIAHNHSALLKLKAHNPSLPSAIRS